MQVDDLDLKRRYSPYVEQCVVLLKDGDVSAELFVEVLGCLANLSLPEFDFGVLVRRHDLLNFLAQFAVPDAVDDDILLEVVMFIGAPPPPPASDQRVPPVLVIVSRVFAFSAVFMDACSFCGCAPGISGHGAGGTSGSRLLTILLPVAFLPFLSRRQLGQSKLCRDCILHSCPAQCMRRVLLLSDVWLVCTMLLAMHVTRAKSKGQVPPQVTTTVGRIALICMSAPRRRPTSAHVLCCHVTLAVVGIRKLT